jgi:hypothetical protein
VCTREIGLAPAVSGLILFGPLDCHILFVVYAIMAEPSLVGQWRRGSTAR